MLGVTQLGGLEGKALQRTPLSAPPWRLCRHGGRKRRFSGATGPAPPLKRQLRKSYLFYWVADERGQTPTRFIRPRSSAVPRRWGVHPRQTTRAKVSRPACLTMAAPSGIVWSTKALHDAKEWFCLIESGAVMTPADQAANARERYSAAIEDYLKAIYTLGRTQDQ